MKERAALMARFQTARKVWDREHQKALEGAGELSEKQRVLLQRELVRDKMAENEDYQRLKELATERGFYQQPYLRRGYVWLFTQR